MSSNDEFPMAVFLNENLKLIIISTSNYRTYLI